MSTIGQSSSPSAGSGPQAPAFVAFFIDRPIFAGVIAILIVIAGLVSAPLLPVSQFPPIAPPSVYVSANFNGASAEVVERTVTLPIEEQVAVTVKGEKFTFGKFGDGAVTALDPTLSPKVIDFKMLRKPESGVTNEAIYKLDKDTLVVVVYLGDDKKRPDGFDVPKDGQTGRFTLKRPK